MNRKTVITITLLILGLGIGLALDQEFTYTQSQWKYNVQWMETKPANAASIEELLFHEIAPYKTDYKNINISTKGEGGRMSIRVISTAVDSDAPDIYDFIYENNELQMTGYLLEAIPSIYRNDAIAVALRNTEIAASAKGIPSVRRILPKTSEKFYAPKILLSVTWKGVSALIDPDDRKVVQVWKESSSNSNSNNYIP